MSEDLAARVAELASLIEDLLADLEATAEAAQLRFPGPWERADNTDSPLPGAVTLYDSRDESVGVIRGSYAAAHIVGNDPDRALRRVRATRDLVTAILAERHQYVDGDPWFSCSQATWPGEEGEPGSACADDERRGKPCDCVRDAKVVRMLEIIASEWEG